MGRTQGVVSGIRMFLFISACLVDMTRAQERPVPEPRFGVAAETASSRVYTSQFEQKKTDGWSVRSIGQAPNGQWFLGEFNKELASLRVTQLPEHALLRVTFDLYVINTWDGSGVISAAGGPAGPDMMCVDVDGARNILRATFSNLPETGNFADDGKRQTYPSPIPSRSVPLGTGALGIHELGYIFTYNPPGVSFPQDSSYTITATFPHDANEVILDFYAMNLQSAADESWGVANLTIEALPDEAAPILSDADQKLAFDRIVRGSVPLTARESFWKLVADGNSTVRYLEKTAAGFGIDQERVAALVRDLDDPAKRDAAVAALVDLGPAVEPLLRDAVRENPKRGVDVDRTLMMIEITPLESPHARATAAAARLLATIATPEAQRVYAALAAKPSPVQPGTPAYEAEWKERFNRVYRLRMDEHIRLIPKPFTPERERFIDTIADRPRIDATQTFIARTGSTADAPDAMLQPVDADAPPIGVARVAGMVGLWGLSIPDSLSGITFEGDWLVRPRLSQKHAIPTFVNFLKHQAGRNVRVDEELVDHYTLHVAGAPTGVPETLELTAEPLDKLVAPAESRLHSMSLTSVLRSTVARAGMDITFAQPFNDQPAQVRIEQVMALQRIKDYDTLQKVLDNIATQTGLKFERKTRKRTQLKLVDLGPVEKP